MAFFSLYFCVAYAKVPHCVPFICKSSRKLRKIDYLVIYLAACTTAGQIINNTVSACAIVHSACSNEDRMGIRNKSVVLVRPALKAVADAHAGESGQSAVVASGQVKTRA